MLLMLFVAVIIGVSSQVIRIHKNMHIQFCYAMKR